MGNRKLWFQADCMSCLYRRTACDWSGPNKYKTKLHDQNRKLTVLQLTDHVVCIQKL